MLVGAPVIGGVVLVLVEGKGWLGVVVGLLGDVDVGVEEVGICGMVVRVEVPNCASEAGVEA